MYNVSPDELRGLARIAGLRVLDEDIEPLTLQFNALTEGLATLDEHDLHDVAPLPALQHPSPPVSGPRSPEAAPPAPSAESDAPLPYKSIAELAGLLRAREISSAELTGMYLDRIERFDSELNSYITVTTEIAREQARRADAALANGEDAGPLMGIPLAHKDEFCTDGVLTTCGSRTLAEYVPDYDAAAIERMHAAGAVMLGKLNMTEWASPLTWVFPYGQPRNPWSLEHDAGGSSTGSGVAVAAALCAGSIGEDTGGSIRRPASCNSVVGLRPSLGRVSAYGMFASNWNQDTVGPLARSVADCALLMNAVAGYDPRDPVSANLPVPDYAAALTGDAVGLRVGVVREAFDAPHLDPRIKQLALDAVRTLESLGAAVADASIPLMTLSGLINGAFGAPRAALHWRYLNDAPELYDVGVRRNTILPALLPASTYQRALQLRALMRAQTLEALARCDVLLAPAYAGFPPLIAAGKSDPPSKEAAVEQMRRYGFHTPANYTGAPAMSVPMGFSGDGLPIGLHIMAKPFDELAIFRAAYAYEQAAPWRAMRPPFGDGAPP